MSGFERVFSVSAETSCRAPGRVNLLGEHTDYNDGYVMPVAIPQSTEVSLGRSSDACWHFHSENLGGAAVWDPSLDPEGLETTGYVRYLVGCIREVEKATQPIPAANVYVSSNVPMGAGLSSSAALEVAMIRALRGWRSLSLDDVSIALMGQRAESQYAGVSCGIMDQFASSLATDAAMLFLDTRTLESRLIALPEETEILVLDSGIQRQLAESGYNQRRQECEAAAQRLNVKALRDVTELSLLEALPEPLLRRARHVVSENLRVLEASQGVSAGRFGVLMNESHLSLKDDYEVSVPMLDRLVTCLQVLPEVYGARLTGAGFGGACVALVEKGTALAVAEAALAAYQVMGGNGRLLVPMQLAH